MTYEEAARILDPVTSREALRPYDYDQKRKLQVIDDACRMAAEVLRTKRETENESYDVNSAIFHVFAIGFKAGKNGEDLFSAYNYFFEKLNLEEQQNDSKC